MRQLTKSANLDRAITLASTVRTDCRRVLGEEHPLSQAVAANLPRARATRRVAASTLVANPSQAASGFDVRIGIRR